MYDQKCITFLKTNSLKCQGEFSDNLKNTISRWSDLRGKKLKKSAKSNDDLGRLANDYKSQSRDTFKAIKYF